MKIFTLILILFLSLSFNQKIFSQTDSTPAAPFAFGDFTWMNGQNRQKTFPLSFGNVNLSLYGDTYYNYSFNDPQDNTQTNSAVTGRHNEFTLNQVSVGLESNYENVIGRILLQFGSMQSIIQETDGSVNHGRNTGTNNFKFIREAAIGYHFDAMHGINLEAGIFMSYIGLESYVTQENWNYQRALVNDFTPSYFTGMRLTMYPSDKLKIEPWLMNGWQSYDKWNKDISGGLSVYYRPKEWLGFIANFYYGSDTKNEPGRKRFNHDNSILMRYYQNKLSSGISKAAFSINTHYGFETGGNGLKSDSAYFFGTSAANRIWFAKDKFALTLRGGYVTNPTRYLASAPTATGFIPGYSGDDGYSLKITEFTTTLDFMPNDFFTFRLEYLNRKANVPYFAGSGGTTSPDGWQPIDPNFIPDLKTSENRFIMAMNFRF